MQSDETVSNDVENIDESRTTVKQSRSDGIRHLAAKRIADLLPPALAATLALLVPVWLYRLWTFPLTIPLNYRGDALPVSMLITEINNGGWFFHEDRLGAPFGQHHVDWPQPNVVTQVWMWLLGIFTNNFGIILNLLYIGAFPLIALSAWWVMRSLGVHRWIAAAFSVVYAILPYHFVRGEAHLYLGMYIPIPLAIWLCVQVLRGAPLLHWSYRFGPLNWYNARTIAFCVLIAGQDPYYGYMAGVLLAASVAARFLLSLQWRAALRDFVPVVVMAGVIVACSLPSLLYYHENGPNPLNASRRPGDTDAFSLKVSHLLLPAAGHRVAPLADYAQRYLSSFPLPSEATSASLGAWGAAGFLVLLAVGLTRMVGKRDGRLNTEAHLSFVVFVAILLATIGGFSTFISLSVTPVFRSLNRISIFIGFCALAALALLCTRALRSLPSRIAMVVLPIVMIAVPLTATFDQTNTPTANNGTVGQYQSKWIGDSVSIAQQQELLKQVFNDDATYFASIERVMPPKSMIYTMPYTEFFAASRYFQLAEFEMLQPFLHTKTLRWSYGAQEGRLEANWNRRLTDDANVSGFLFDVIAAGFDGVLVDKNGYATGAGEQRINDIGTLLGKPPMHDPAGNRAFFDLRAYASALRSTQSAQLSERKSQLLFPASIEAPEHFRDIERNELGTFQWAERQAVNLPIRNVSQSAQSMHVTFSLATRINTPATFTVQWPDGSTDVVVTNEVPKQVEKNVSVKPGRSVIKISSNAVCQPDDATQLCFRVLNVRDGVNVGD